MRPGEKRRAMLVEVSEAWKESFPGAVVGTLAIGGVTNPPSHAGLEERKREVEGQIRERFAGASAADIRKMGVMQAYRSYYRGHKKSYHVQIQLESMLFKGRSLPNVSALVDAMFMAEMKNLLLTAGHDLDAVRMPVEVGVSTGSERYTRLNGEEQVLKPGDMMMADRVGVISSVLYGPDRRTRIMPNTGRAFFVVYAPDGVGEQAVRTHLEEIRDSVLLVAPGAIVESLDIHVAG